MDRNFVIYMALFLAFGAFSTYIYHKADEPAPLPTTPAGLVAECMRLVKGSRSNVDASELAPCLRFGTSTTTPERQEPVQ